MKLVSYDSPNGPTLGVLDGELVYPCRSLGFTGTLLDLIEAGPQALDRIRKNLAKAGTSVAAGKVAELKLLAPIGRPKRDIFCAGKNYADHAAEYTKSGYDKPGAAPVPDIPVTFFKLANTVIGPADDIPSHADATSELDYEAELGAVLSRGGRGLSENEAENCIFGYILVNDVTARDWQKGHDQWVIGKSFDGFCPIGPIVLTADEVSDVSELSFTCHVNDELRQQGDPSKLIYSVPKLIEYFSKGIEMQPGDLIATGSPLGPGIGFDPPRFLKPGDRVRIESKLLGVMENTVVA